MAGDHSTPNIPSSSAVFTLHCKAEIDAPTSLVFETFLDTSTWASWNVLSPRADILVQGGEGAQKTNQQPVVTINNTAITAGPGGASVSVHSPIIRKGTIFGIHTIRDKSGSQAFTNFLCWDLDAEKRRVVWIYDHDHSPWPKALLEVERVTEVVDLGEGRSEIRTWENQKGLLAFWYKIRYKDALVKGFEDQVLGLKIVVEQAWKDKQAKEAGGEKCP